MVWSTNLDGTETHINPAAEKVYGRPAEDFVRSPRLWLDTVHPEDRSRVAASDARVRETGRDELEYRIVRPDGTIRWVHDRKAMICDDAGVPIRLGGVLSDISELNEMHRRVAEAEHLAELGELGASVAHEIRNPLTGISGVLQVVGERLPEEDPAHGAVEEALLEVGRVEETIRRLLLYARPWQPEMKCLDIRAFAEQSCLPWAQRMEEAGCQVTVAPGPPLRACFDPELLEEVCANLLQNAAQAMEQDGEITVRFEDDGALARIIVHDQGPGFPPESFERVFEAFYTTKARGTGLGLPICRRIIEAQGGRIYAANAPGGGAKVVIELPKEEGPCPDASSSSTTKS